MSSLMKMGLGIVGCAGTCLGMPGVLGRNVDLASFCQDLRGCRY